MTTVRYEAPGSIDEAVALLAAANGAAYLLAGGTDLLVQLRSGLIKPALSLKHRRIPATLHFGDPNPLINFEELKLRVPRSLAPAFRTIRHVQPWSMMEVFLIAILVALVKLVDMADIIPGLALWAFAVLILVLAGTASTLDPRAVWAHVETTR